MWLMMLNRSCTFVKWIVWGSSSCFESPEVSLVDADATEGEGRVAIFNAFDPIVKRGWDG